MAVDDAGTTATTQELPAIVGSAPDVFAARAMPVGRPDVELADLPESDDPTVIRDRFAPSQLASSQLASSQPESSTKDGAAPHRLRYVLLVMTLAVPAIVLVALVMALGAR